MAAANDDDPGFWPGYVAAVAGLVQGLLIMTMALGISIFALGQLAALSRRGQVATAGPKPAAVTELPPSTLPDFLPPPVKLPPEPSLGLLPPPVPIGTTPGKTIAITFLGDAVMIPQTSEADLVEAIQRDSDAGSASWQVRLATDVEDPRARRAGYLRLLSLRNILLKTGVKPDRVTVSLVVAGAGFDTESVTAEIVPMDINGRPMRRSRLA